jgi:hypothetical protein
MDSGEEGEMADGANTESRRSESTSRARRKGTAPLRAPGFALLVIGLDGEEAYLCNGMGDTPTRFFSKREAQSQKDFLWIGMEGDVQSINIVPYPKVVMR